MSGKLQSTPWHLIVGVGESHQEVLAEEHFFNYLGNLEYGFVTNGNSMISRNFDLQTVMFFYQVFLAVSSSDKRDFESLTRGHEMP